MTKYKIKLNLNGQIVKNLVNYFMKIQFVGV